MAFLSMSACIRTLMFRTFQKLVTPFGTEMDFEIATGFSASMFSTVFLFGTRRLAKRRDDYTRISTFQLGADGGDGGLSAATRNMDRFGTRRANG